MRSRLSLRRRDADSIDAPNKPRPRRRRHGLRLGVSTALSRTIVEGMLLHHAAYRRRQRSSFDHCVLEQSGTLDGQAPVQACSKIFLRPNNKQEPQQITAKDRAESLPGSSPATCVLLQTATRRPSAAGARQRAGCPHARSAGACCQLVEAPAPPADRESCWHDSGMHRSAIIYAHQRMLACKAVCADQIHRAGLDSSNVSLPAALTLRHGLMEAPQCCRRRAAVPRRCCRCQSHAPLMQLHPKVLHLWLLRRCHRRHAYRSSLRLEPLMYPTLQACSVD